MDSGTDNQFTCCRESKRETPPASALAKIRSSMSPDAPGINHTAVMARRREGERASEQREAAAWHWHCVEHACKCTAAAGWTGPLLCAGTECIWNDASGLLFLAAVFCLLLHYILCFLSLHRSCCRGFWKTMSLIVKQLLKIFFLKSQIFYNFTCSMYTCLHLIQTLL